MVLSLTENTVLTIAKHTFSTANVILRMNENVQHTTSLMLYMYTIDIVCHCTMSSHPHLTQQHLYMRKHVYTVSSVIE